MEKHTAAPDAEALTVERPVRGADRNRSRENTAGPAAGDEVQVLPSLDPGITLLDIEADRGVPVIHSLVLDELLVSDGPAFWVDANGYATTTSLARLAPSMRLLDRIHVARGFTAYQHYRAVSSVPDAVKRSIRAATRSEDDTHPKSGGDSDGDGTPSILVAPAIDAPYRSEDALGEEQAETLLTRSLAELTAIADTYDIPVLLTRTTRGPHTTPIESAASQQLTCESTRMGPRFVGDDFETLVYPVEDGQYYQTTFAYWRQLLGTRAAQVGISTDSPGRSPSPETGSVGTGITTDGKRPSVTTDPMRDAWSTATTASPREQ